MNVREKHLLLVDIDVINDNSGKLIINKFVITDKEKNTYLITKKSIESVLVDIYREIESMSLNEITGFRIETIDPDCNGFDFIELSLEKELVIEDFYKKKGNSFELDLSNAEI